MNSTGIRLSLAMQSSEMMSPPVVQLFSLAISLVAQWKGGEGTSYIDEAIVLDYEALELCPPGRPERASSLTLLAIHLGDRYSQLGKIEDLEEAIVLNREALDLRPQGHPDRSMSFNSSHLSVQPTRRNGRSRRGHCPQSRSTCSSPARTS